MEKDIEKLKSLKTRLKRDGITTFDHNGGLFFISAFLNQFIHKIETKKDNND